MAAGKAVEANCPLCTLRSSDRGDMKNHLKSFHNATFNVDRLFSGAETRRGEDNSDEVEPAVKKVKEKAPNASKVRLLSQLDVAASENPQTKSVDGNVATRRKKSDTRRFACPDCDFATIYWRNWKAHMKRGVHTMPHAKTILDCPYCRVKMTGSKTYESHMAENHPDVEAKYRCPQCNYGARHSDTLRQHMRYNHSRKSCRHCQFIAAGSAELREHVGTEHANAIAAKKPQVKKTIAMDCPHCPEKPLGIIRFESHVMSAHPDVEDKFRCADCDRGMRTYETFKHHRRRKHARRPCQHCDFTAQGTENLDRHVAADHPEAAEMQVGHEEVSRCRLCSFVAGTKSEQRKHVKMQHGDENRCDECDFTTANRSYLTVHKLKFHSGNFSLLSCPDCDFKTVRDARLANHKRQVHEGWPDLECELCTFKTLYRMTLRHHLLKSHPENAAIWNRMKMRLPKKPKKRRRRNNNCDLCDYTASSRGGMRKHLRSEHGMGVEGKHACSECSRKFASYAGLARHSAIAHKKKLKKPKECPTASCHFMADSARKLKLHRLTVHDGLEAYNCGLCTYATVKSKMLQIHRWSKHSEQSKSCEECGFVGDTRRAVTFHKQTVHDGLEAINCSLCEYASVNPINLRLHQKYKHSKRETRACKDCGYMAETVRELRLHKHTVHDGLVAYNCKQCDYAATTSKLVMDHVRLQHTERRHICPNCNKTFSYRKWWARHMRVWHSIEEATLKKVCNFDGCRFEGKNLRQLVFHERTVHENWKVLACGQCSYKTEAAQRLARHVDVRHREATMECGDCELSFATSMEMANHRFRKHGHGQGMKKEKAKCSICRLVCGSQAELTQHILGSHVG